MLSRGHILRSVSGKRLFSSSSRILGVWSDFSKRSESLKVENSNIRKDILEGINKDLGPHSIDLLERRLAYHSPLEVDETFKLSYELLEEDSENYYKQIEILKQKLTNAQDKEAQEIKKEIYDLSIKAEKFNPEVMFKAEYSSESLDRTQPVYRDILKKKWESYDLMITMQRLEQLYVIPDTMPTLDPLVDVKVKFPHNTDEEFSSWVTPGEILPSFAVSQPPTIQVQEFDAIEEEQLYTVVVVNPDAPDLSTNSFKTILHYGLANVPLNNVNNTIDTKLIMENKELTFKEYEPLLPEKNAQTQRACLWVFRQSKKLPLSGEFEKDNFDIRAFASENELTAVGAHVWRQHFDRSTNKIRSDYGLPKGRVFYRVRRPNPVI